MTTKKTPAKPEIDFAVTYGPMSTMWAFTARTEAAKEFVRLNVDVPDWAGTEEQFHADWRPARDLAFGLIDEGFVVAVNGRIATGHK